MLGIGRGRAFKLYFSRIVEVSSALKYLVPEYIDRISGVDARLS
jgi:hypothetical protein